MYFKILQKSIERRTWAKYADSETREPTFPSQLRHLLALNSHGSLHSSVPRFTYLESGNNRSALIRGLQELLYM